MDLLRVDEASRILYFTATGRERGRNPYYRHLYSVGLDGGEPKLLTPENADHDFATGFVFAAPGGGSISPSGRYFIDSYSTISEPDTVVLKTIDGRAIADVAQADISQLSAAGWQPPEQFIVKAADGVTDLYGIIIKPQAFDPLKKYPVIEITYPGQGGKLTPTTFRENFQLGTTLNAYAFAEAGAIVVALDGRGGGLRSKKFRTAFVGSDDILGAVDHVAAIKAAGASRPYMDLDRVGITGHSMGGYATTRSMLLFPKFYKVGVSGESPADWMISSIDIATEGIAGVPTDPATIDYYRRISMESIADRLQGKLLLIFAGLDENVPFQSAFQTFRAFEKANKVYDT
ncbi:prolyl oligopeptidase family serine peptidase [Sphingobium sp. TB-6]|uniref:alpha/beta hydrolase family protein n=1 Tax=Sphingobium sp. TB-6 TaxID=2728850 RepID=UPI00146F6BEF|nr:prolyl oligopeptidase family serine peptidase [Sphingobium sp. TB-6]NML87458.1 prolyl oligopeptidase family serine peptidase [Sphingobium sp. TB-6]